MNPLEATRQASRILRDAACSMRRDVSEAERLLRLAAGLDETEAVELRRNLEAEYAANPEFFAGVPS